MHQNLCLKCGKQMDNDANFCIHCGSSLGKEAAADKIIKSGLLWHFKNIISGNRVIAAVLSIVFILFIYFQLPIVKSKMLVTEGQRQISEAEQMESEGLDKINQANELRSKAEERWATSDRDKLLSEANKLFDEGSELVDKSQQLKDEGNSSIKESKRLANDFTLSEEEKDQFIRSIETQMVPKAFGDSSNISYDFKNFEFKYQGNGKYEVTFEHYFEGKLRAIFITIFDNKNSKKRAMIGVKERYDY